MQRLNVIGKTKTALLGDRMDEDIQAVTEKMEAVIEDTGVPRNIRKIVEDAKVKITEAEDKSVGITAAIYALDDVSNDINMPFHTRTEIWGIISDLEAIRENNK